MFDSVSSRKIAHLTLAETKACWINAVRAMMVLEELQTALYVEGYCLTSGIPLEHGWLEQENDGEIIILDPTLILLNVVDAQYFAGVRYTYQDVCTFWDTPLPRVCQDGRGGMTNNTYKAAFLRAYRTSFPTFPSELQGI